MTWNPMEDAWLAGFADGEACFQIKRNLQPRFTIALRDDDVEVLERLADVFGGTITYGRWATPSVNRQRQAVWTVLSKRDLSLLALYFDVYPLRAKKARDYQIWREAVVAYCESGRAAADQLGELRESLMAGRVYA